MDRDQLWRKVVDRKYGVYDINGVHQQLEASMVWEYIRFGWDLFSKFIRYEVGDGTCI